MYDSNNFEPELTISFLIRKVFSELSHAVDTNLASFDITHAQFTVLSQLSEKKVTSQSELCKAINYDSGAMTRMLDRLERKCMVRRIL